MIHNSICEWFRFVLSSIILPLQIRHILHHSEILPHRSEFVSLDLNYLTRFASILSSRLHWNIESLLSNSFCSKYLLQPYFRSLHHTRFLIFHSSVFRCIFRDTANGPFSLNRFQFQVLSCDKQYTFYSSILPYTRIADLTLLDHFCVEYTPPICFPSCHPSILVALKYIITDMQF